MSVQDSVARVTAFTEAHSRHKVDGLSHRGHIKQVPADDRIAGMANGSELLASDLEVLLAAVKGVGTEVR